MNKKIIVGVAIVLVVVIAVAVVFLFPRLSPEQQELDLTIRVESPEIYYIPFRTSADERWNLTIECLEMPSDLAWVTILHYNDYWDEGTDCRCQQEDLYSIATELTELQKIAVDPEIQQKYPLHAEYNTTVYTGIYGTSKAQSFTIFIPSPRTYHDAST